VMWAVSRWAWAPSWRARSGRWSSVSIAADHAATSAGSTSVLDDPGDAQLDRTAGLYFPECFDEQVQALLWCDASGEGDHRWVAGLVAIAESAGDEVTNRARDEMDPVGEVGFGVSQQRSHVLAHDHDAVGFCQ